MNDLSATLRRQAGVVTRRQLLAAGLAPHDLRRLVRRHELRAVARGVYVDHTGPLTWTQQAWRAVLAVPGSALSHRSAIEAAAGSGDGTLPIHVGVDRHSSVAAPGGVRLHHIADLAGRLHPTSSIPRVRVEEAVLDVAAACSDEVRTVAQFCDAVQAGLTTAPRLRATLRARSRVRHRLLLDAALGDIAYGTASALEWGYLDRVERAHGLPAGRGQVRTETPGGTVYRDLDHSAYGLAIELDGRAHHSSAAVHDRDLERDPEAAVPGLRTVRLGWGQVFGRPCETASRLAELFILGGWCGLLVRCASCR